MWKLFNADQMLTSNKSISTKENRLCCFVLGGNEHKQHSKAELKVIDRPLVAS